jgi:hypothetical protein
MRIDEEAAPTMKYTAGAFLPTLGGDARFSFRLPLHWRGNPVTGRNLFARSRRRCGWRLPQAMRIEEGAMR